MGFIVSIILVKLNLISYNQEKILFPLFNVPPFQQISAGIVVMIMIHFVPKYSKWVLLYIAAFSIITNLIVVIAIQLNVISFDRWNHFLNLILDFVALGTIYYIYKFYLRDIELSRI